MRLVMWPRIEQRYTNLTSDELAADKLVTGRLFTKEIPCIDTLFEEFY